MNTVSKEQIRSFRLRAHHLDREYRAEDAEILAGDRQKLEDAPCFGREVLLLGGHDPYLDQRDRDTVQPDPKLRQQLWRTVGNPGAVILRGKGTGIWNSRKKGEELTIEIRLWEKFPDKKTLSELSERYADFRGLKLRKLQIGE